MELHTRSIDSSNRRCDFKRFERVGNDLLWLFVSNSQKPQGSNKEQNKIKNGDKNKPNEMINQKNCSKKKTKPIVKPKIKRKTENLNE